MKAVDHVEANERRMVGRGPLSAGCDLGRAGIAVAQRAAVPKPQDKLALGEPEVKQLLLLMDTDKSGTCELRA